MITWLLLISITGFLGLLVGAVLRSDWERKARGGLMPWLPFGQGSFFKILAGLFLIKLPLVAALFLGPLLFAAWAVRSFGLISLSAGEHRLLFMIYLVAIAVGKGLRYMWWRRRLA